MSKHFHKPTFSEIYKDLKKNGLNANRIFNEALKGNGTADKTKKETTEQNGKIYSLKNEKNVKEFASEIIEPNKFYIDLCDCIKTEWMGKGLKEAIANYPYDEFIGDWKEIKSLVWFAICDNEEDDDYSIGTRDFNEALEMLRKRKTEMPTAVIKSLEETTKDGDIIYKEIEIITND